MKRKSEEREKVICNQAIKMKKESYNLLKEVPSSKFNINKLLINEYFDYSGNTLNNKGKEPVYYFDICYSLIKIMKEKFNKEIEINEEMKKKMMKIKNI